MSFHGAHGGAYSTRGREYLAVDPTLPLSTALSYVLLALIGAYSFVHYLDILPTLPLTQLAWNALVYATPPSLVIALEARHRTSASAQTFSQTYAETRTLAAKSEVMRRSLGLSSGGLLYSVQRSRRMSGLNGMLRYGSSNSLPGLGNWDNSCYQNSVLQGLAALPTLHNFLDHASQHIPDSGTRRTNAALQHLVEDLNNPKNLGHKMWTPAVLKSMSSWQQQDAQEYYSKVVDVLEKELIGGIRESAKGNAMRSDLSSVKSGVHESDGASSTMQIRNPLEGMLAQRVGCLRCRHVDGLSLIPFNCLTVPLGDRPVYDIAACLDEYTALEPITGVECPRCTLLSRKKVLENLLADESSLAVKTCSSSAKDDPTSKAEAEERSIPSAEPAILNDSAGKDEKNTPDHDDRGASQSYQLQSLLQAVNTALEEGDFSDSTLSKKCFIPNKLRVLSTKTRQAVIARTPKALVIHVNRSMFDEYTGYMSKNYAVVRFPMLLDVSKWSLGVTSEDTETWSTDPAQSILDTKTQTRDPNPESTSSTSFYALRAVVTHQGRHENGHYIAYRQNPLPSKDSPLLDRSWWRLSDEDVTVTDEETVLAQGGVFMLFYEQALAEEKQALMAVQAKRAVHGIDSTDEGRPATPNMLEPGSPVHPPLSRKAGGVDLQSLIPARSTSLAPGKVGTPSSASDLVSSPGSYQSPDSETSSTVDSKSPASPPPISSPAVTSISTPSSARPRPGSSGSPAIPPRKASRKNNPLHSTGSHEVPRMRTSGVGEADDPPPIRPIGQGMVSAN